MTEAPDHWKTVRHCELFRGVPEPVLREIVNGRRPLTLARGQTLFRRGDPADAFFVVLSGWMKLSRTGPQGAETIVHVAKAGESFAEAVMFMESAFPVDAEAATDVTLLRIDASVMRAHLSADATLAFAMLAAMSLRLRGLVDEIERLKGRSALSRLASFLLEFCGEGETASFELPFGKALIAARLGITPESLSRALARLRGFGAIVAKDHVEVTSSAALRRLAAGEPRVHRAEHLS